ncbi:MAG: type I-E CRISPR-associated protein Cas6/Cse3/CasE [candidate division WS1 bacterium]|nr:type I-E CRISPR-associated protein Cas6/Cse3/CasE [candidate division WS1 bacterium]
MYLSRLILDPRSRRVRSELAAAYEMHRTLMQGFPASLPADERVLFRVDVDRRSGVPVVLVQSRHRPDWSLLASAERYLLDVSDRGLLNPDCKAVHLSLTGGQLLGFRLRANPAYKRGGKRLAWLTEPEQLRWLERKGHEGGFRVMAVTVIPEGWQESSKGDGVTRLQLKHYSVRFDGHLRVTDPQVFLETIASGVGPAKGLGFGLLSVAPP